MIDANRIEAVLVTRGDVDLAPILEPLPYPVTVWNNKERPFDARVLGRYLAIAETTAPVIFFQDDDCVVTCHEQLRQAYKPGHIVANMVTEHRRDEPPMLGWGALFARHLPGLAFKKWYAAGHPLDWRMTKYPETIFTALTPCIRLGIGSHANPATKGHVDLPWADTPGRSFKQPGHYEEYALVLEQARAVAAAQPAPEPKIGGRELRLTEHEAQVAKTLASLARDAA